MKNRATVIAVMSIAAVMGLAMIFSSDTEYHEKRTQKAAVTASKEKITPLPKVRLGEHYYYVRQNLLHAGWFAAPVADMNPGENISFIAQEIRNKGYQEVEDCAGTGLTPCNFLFRDVHGNQFRVTTTGQAAVDGRTPEDLKVSHSVKIPVSEVPPSLSPANTLSPTKKSWCDEILSKAYAANDRTQKDSMTIPADVSLLSVPESRRNIRDFIGGIIAYERAGCGKQDRIQGLQSAEQANADWADGGRMEAEIESHAQEILRSKPQ